jgi:capsular polysaccharide biosynthesis protein
VPEDEPFFRDEYRYDMNEPEIRHFTRSYFNSEGYVYRNYSVVRDGLRIGYEIRDNQLKNFIKCRFLSKGKISDPVIFIHDNWSEGYFHWHGDALPRLEFLSNHIHLPDHKLVLPEHYLRYEYIPASLKYFGLSSKHILPLEYSKVYYADDISYCTQFAISGNYHSGLMQKLSARIKSAAGLNDIAPTKKIYISRENAAKRKVLNEAEVTDVLKKHGFEIYLMEKLSYEEQLRLMASAKWLVSIHGAGLTNMLFMHEGSSVLEIRREEDGGNNCYFSMAAAKNLPYYYLNAISVNSETDHIGDLLIDCNKLDDMLSRYL